MSSRWYPIAAVALLVAAIGAAIFAANRDPQSLKAAAGAASSSDQTAPPLEANGWINSPPLAPVDLKGKVVLYDFWTYSCVNCVRTIPYIGSWHDRYERDGLVIIGIHSPEFQFEKDHANVAEAVKKLGVNYPVALDDDMVIWNSFSNQYWPAHYIFDRQGHLADTHFGEGAYAETESLLRKLLGVADSSPKAKLRGAADESKAAAGELTPETYVGGARGSEGFASPEPLSPGEQTYSTPAELRTNQHALDGTWSVSDEFAQATKAGSAIQLRYKAGEVNLVMATADGKPVDVTVEVDGKLVRTVRVTASDLYSLVKEKVGGEHSLRLVARRAGLRAFAFTFGA